MSEPTTLALTGERTVPGIADEAYWFARHVVAYDVAAARAFGRHVLDAGCGEGYGAAALRAAGAERVVAVDLDPEVVAHVGGAYPEVEVARAELGALPFADGTFDLIVSFQVIEHVWDPAGYLASLRRVLHPRGELLIATPNRLTFTPGSETPTNPFHVREFAPGELRDELTAAGLRVRALLGIHHGPLLRVAGSIYGRRHAGGLAARIAETPPSTWPTGLRTVVHRTNPTRFAIATDRLDESLDVLAICAPADDR